MISWEARERFKSLSKQERFVHMAMMVKGTRDGEGRSAHDGWYAFNRYGEILKEVKISLGEKGMFLSSEEKEFKGLELRERKVRKRQRMERLVWGGAAGTLVVIVGLFYFFGRRPKPATLPDPSSRLPSPPPLTGT